MKYSIYDYDVTNVTADTTTIPHKKYVTQKLNLLVCSEEELHGVVMRLVLGDRIVPHCVADRLREAIKDNNEFT
jgi:hypothetical protein